MMRDDQSHEVEVEGLLDLRLASLLPRAQNIIR